MNEVQVNSQGNVQSVDFTSQEPMQPQRSSQTEMMVTRQAQEVQVAMLAAKKFPRDQVVAYNKSYISFSGFGVSLCNHLSELSHIFSGHIICPLIFLSFLIYRKFCISKFTCHHRSIFQSLDTMHFFLVFLFPSLLLQFFCPAIANAPDCFMEIRTVYLFLPCLSAHSAMP